MDTPAAGPAVTDDADAAPVRATLAPWAMALQAEMLQEMVCRALKSLVRSRQRSWMKGTRSTSEHGIRQVRTSVVPHHRPRTQEAGVPTHPLTHLPNHPITHGFGPWQVIVRFLNLVTGAWTEGTGSRGFWEKDVAEAVAEHFGAVAWQSVPLSCARDAPAMGAEWAVPPALAAWAGLGTCTGTDAAAVGAAKSPTLSPWQLVTGDQTFLFHRIIPRFLAMSGVRVTAECAQHLADFQALLGQRQQPHAHHAQRAVARSPTSRRTTDVLGGSHSAAVWGSPRAASIGAATAFEFVIADVAELVPLVKHMHQLDLCEGLALSMEAEGREKRHRRSCRQHTEDPTWVGALIRLVQLASHRLRKVLKYRTCTPRSRS